MIQTDNLIPLDRTSTYNIQLKGLHAVESLIGTSLPEEYKHFLIQHHGYEPNHKTFLIEGDEHSCLDTMYRLSGDTDYFDLYNRVVFDKDLLEYKVIPFANDVFGNDIAIGYSTENYQHIYFVNRDGATELTKIADTFADFFNNLVDIKEVVGYENEMDKIIHTNDFETFTTLLNNGYDFEKEDKYSSTLLEILVLETKVDMIEFLLPFKPQLRKSLEIARDNYRFNPDEFEETLKIIEEYCQL